MPRLDVVVRGLATPVAAIAAVALPDAAAGDPERSADRQGQKINPRPRPRTWSNVPGPGDGNISRHRPGRFWSGACSMTDGGRADDPARGGAIEMPDPRGPGLSISIAFTPGPSARAGG